MEVDRTCEGMYSIFQKYRQRSCQQSGAVPREKNADKNTENTENQSVKRERDSDQQTFSAIKSIVKQGHCRKGSSQIADPHNYDT